MMCSSCVMIQQDRGDLESSDGTQFYYLGIIDVLTKWTALKRLEHDCKAVQYGRGVGGISCVHPSIYASKIILHIVGTIKKKYINTN